MKKNNKFVLIFLFIMLLLMLLVIFLAKKNNNETINNNNIILNNSTNNTYKENKTENSSIENISFHIREINTTKVYYSLNNIVNDYYNYIYNNDSKSLLYILSEQYIKNNNINENNVLDKISNRNSNFYIKDVVLSSFEDDNYYFVEGQSLNYSSDDVYKSISNDKFLIKINNNYFSIEPLDSNDTLLYIANNYIYSRLDIQNNQINNYNYSSIKNNQIEMIYKNYYLILLYDDPEYAYSMLSDNMKKIYSSYDSFKENIDAIINVFSKKIFGERTYKENGNTVYDVDMYEDYNIIFREKKYMTFTVEFK